MFGGLPVPGASVTAVQTGKESEKKFAVTDQMGGYSFPDLADGTWTIQVDMQLFSSQQREVVIAPDAMPPAFELKLLPADEITKGVITGLVVNTPEVKAAAPAPVTSRH